MSKYNKEYQKEYRIKHNVALKEYKHIYDSTRKAKQKIENKKWRIENALKLKTKIDNNRPQINAWKKNFREKHKDKINAGQKVRRIRNKPYYKDLDLKKRFGKTFGLDQYNTMLSNQNNLCLICKNPEHQIQHGKIQALGVDHCHTTGRIRGLLCSNCNRGIGLMRDNPQLLRIAADYLEAYIIKV